MSIVSEKSNYFRSVHNIRNRKRSLEISELGRRPRKGKKVLRKSIMIIIIGPLLFDLSLVVAPL